MGVKGKPDIIDVIEKKRLQWYGHVKRMPEERISKLVMDWIPRERRKRGRPRKTWMERVQAAITRRNLEPDQWRNRKEWRLVSGRRRQVLKKTGQIDRFTYYVPENITSVVKSFRPMKFRKNAVYTENQFKSSAKVAEFSCTRVTSQQNWKRVRSQTQLCRLRCI